MKSMDIQHEFAESCSQEFHYKLNESQEIFKHHRQYGNAERENNITGSTLKISMMILRIRKSRKRQSEEIYERIRTIFTIPGVFKTGF